MGRLDGKVAVVTGGGGDIGGETAARFAAEGASVLVHDIDASAVDTRVSEIVDAGGRARGHVCDVTDSAAIDAMFTEVAHAFGIVDVLVNCAGTSGHGDKDPAAGPLGLSDAAWSRLLSVHLDGSFYCTRAMVRGLVSAQRGGSIICISSIAGLSGYGHIHYSTAKGGLLGFVRAVARAGGPLGLRANAVCPGVIAAGITKPVPPDVLEPMRMLTPLQRYGTPADVAAACLYLASDESSFVTGQWLSPNGGFVIA